MEIFQKTMDFFQKNSHVFRISWEKIEGTREKNKKKEGIYKKTSTAETKGIHDRNKKASTAKTNPRQKQKGFHTK